MEAMLGISLYSNPYLRLAKTLCFLIIAYVFSSTKLEKRQNRFCLEVKAVGEIGKGWGKGGRNDPNNVCTYE
jgi:hypothetical protein